MSKGLKMLKEILFMMFTFLIKNIIDYVTKNEIIIKTNPAIIKPLYK